MWGCKDYNGYHENSNDFIARGYKDREGYHKDIEDRATQDEERRWPRPDPSAYPREEGRHSPSNPNHRNNYSASS